MRRKAISKQIYNYYWEGLNKNINKISLYQLGLVLATTGFSSGQIVLSLFFGNNRFDFQFGKVINVFGSVYTLSFSDNNICVHSFALELAKLIICLIL